MPRLCLTVPIAAVAAFGSAVLVGCAPSAWTPDQGYDVRLVNTTQTVVTVKYCGNGGIDSCVVDGTVEPGRCSQTLTINSVSSEPGRGAVFEIVGPERENGYIVVMPSGNNQAFDVAPHWPDADQALKSPSLPIAFGCG